MNNIFTGRNLRAPMTIFALLFLQFVHAQQFNGKYYNNLDNMGVILDGYDPVAFFTDNKPVKGDPANHFSYQDATYYFVSPEHLKQFQDDPEKYKPQFGGWCAYAVSLGRVAPIDVNTFSIVDGRLVLQHNNRAVAGWNKDVAGNLQKADKYWPAVSGGGGKQIVKDVLHVDVATESVQVVINDMSGKSIKTFQLQAGMHTVSVGDLSRGIYQLVTYVKGKVAASKLVTKF